MPQSGNIYDVITTDERIIEARNEFRGKRIGYGEGALWKNGNWKLVQNLWRPSWGEAIGDSYARAGFRLRKSRRNTQKETFLLSCMSRLSGRSAV